MRPIAQPQRKFTSPFNDMVLTTPHAGFPEDLFGNFIPAESLRLGHLTTQSASFTAGLANSALFTSGILRSSTGSLAQNDITPAAKLVLGDHVVHIHLQSLTQTSYAAI
jgi:hypothetical protein